eukprot:TRINITY_DN1118_c0_g1_i4.p1 TRINITY_DN1118_c0_g1~~TRINITY_DN1118_c0_g1_i4.p1  ORF type:complete len:974 (+),score=354.12 TRINITY_DN1118_c0_g1_i4:131-3052(+)
MSGGTSVAKGLYDFEARSTAELSFKVGDLINVVNKYPSGWWVGELNGKRGAFPGNYVEEVTQNSSSTQPPQTSRSSSSIGGDLKASLASSTGSTSSTGSSILVISPDDKRPKVRAKTAYTGKHSTHLSFKEGDVIAVIEKFPTGWWKGELLTAEKPQGIFPASHVEPWNGTFTSSQASVEDQAPELPPEEDTPDDGKPVAKPTSGGSSTSNQAISLNNSTDASTKSLSGSGSSTSVSSLTATKAKAMYKYDGLSASELSFQAGDILDILADLDKGWSKASFQGKIGLVPTSYFQKLTSASNSAEGTPQKPMSRATSTNTVGQDVKAHHQKAVALFDYEGTSQSELSFRKGDLIIIHEKLDRGWLRGEFNGRVGHVPADFVKIGTDLERSGSTTKISNVVASGSNDSTSSAKTRPMSVMITPNTSGSSTASRHKSTGSWDSNTAENTFRVRALYDYTGQSTGELSFTRGEEFMVLEKLQLGWWRGVLKSKIGHFPAAFVEPIQEGNKKAADQDAASGVQVIANAVAMYDYTGSSDAELSFSKGDKLEVTEKLDKGWWKGRLVGTDKVGFFPGSYVSEVKVEPAAEVKVEAATSQEATTTENVSPAEVKRSPTTEKLPEVKRSESGQSDKSDKEGKETKAERAERKKKEEEEKKQKKDLKDQKKRDKEEKKQKEEEERKRKEDEEHQGKEEQERLKLEEQKREEEARLHREETERLEREEQERQRVEVEERQKQEEERRKEEEHQRKLEAEENQKRAKEAERLENERKAREAKEREDREAKEREAKEHQRKEREVRETQEREAREAKEREAREHQKKEREEKERQDRERQQQEEQERQEREKAEQESHQKETEVQSAVSGGPSVSPATSQSDLEEKLSRLALRLEEQENRHADRVHLMEVTNRNMEQQVKTLEAALEGETRARRELDAYVNRLQTEIEKVTKRLKKVEDDVGDLGSPFIKQHQQGLKKSGFDLTK